MRGRSHCALKGDLRSSGAQRIGAPRIRSAAIRALPRARYGPPRRSNKEATQEMVWVVCKFAQEWASLGTYAEEFTWRRNPCRTKAQSAIACKLLVCCARIARRRPRRPSRSTRSALGRPAACGDPESEKSRGRRRLGTPREPWSYAAGEDCSCPVVLSASAVACDVQEESLR